MVTDPAARVDLPMVCTCGDREAAGEALYRHVKAALGRGSEHLRSRKVTDRSFVADFLLSLWVDYGADVESITVDQWSMIDVESGPAGAGLQVVIQADEPSLGRAAISDWYSARAAVGA